MINLEWCGKIWVEESYDGKTSSVHFEGASGLADSKTGGRVMFDDPKKAQRLYEIIQSILNNRNMLIDTERVI